MELVTIIGVGVIAFVVLVMLFGPKPRNEVSAPEPEDQTDRPNVDFFPPGGGH